METEDGDPFLVSFEKVPNQIPLPSIKRIAIDQSDTCSLRAMYQRLYPENVVRHVSNFCDNLLYAGSNYRANLFKNCQASTITVQWFDETKKPGVIRRLLLHKAVIEKENGKCTNISHILAEMDWYSKHVNQHRYSNPIEVWGTDFEPHSHKSYMPVGRMQECCVVVRHKIPLGIGSEKQTVKVIIPLPKVVTL